LFLISRCLNEKAAGTNESRSSRKNNFRKKNFQTFFFSWFDTKRRCRLSGLPDFYWSNIPKREEIYQMASK
jgi:hypothetical protein